MQSTMQLYDDCKKHVIRNINLIIRQSQFNWEARTFVIKATDTGSIPSLKFVFTAIVLDIYCSIICLSK